jgi:flagellin-like hook-associated protein FlgL
MAAIVPIPTTRVSDLLIRQRLQTQLQSDQFAIVRLQDQLSTGRRILLPSEDAPAALRAVSIQSLLERKDQVRKNLATNELYLRSTDSALSNASDLLAQIRASALAVIGGGSTDSQRQAAGLEVDAALRNLINAGNQAVNGRFLFGGSATVMPFELVNDAVWYHGNEQPLQSYGDVDLLFQTNLPGDQVFGGLTGEVLGIADLNPALTADTLLSDLHGGLGIRKGTISVSDGVNTRLVDLSKANTVGDVVALLEANPPSGRQIRVDLSNVGLNVQIDAAGGGSLTIQDVGDGQTAADLGILRAVPAGVTPIVGTDLDPRVTLTTRLRDILGSRARAVMSPGGINNDLIFTANQNGAQYNNVSITLVDGGLGTAGNEVAVYNSVTNTLTITIESGVSTANQVIAAVNAEGTFSATLDLHETDNNGTGIIQATALDPAASATTAGGSGFDFDQTSGLQVTNGGATTTINFAAATTVEDLLNTLNGSTAGLVARINAAGTGIDIRSRISGTDFQIGENGGATATQLGVRSLTISTLLSSLNFGRGVQQTAGTDFVIERRDGTRLEIDLAGAETIGDVLNLINNHPQNANPATRVVAQLVPTGNGIQLVNDDPTGTSPLRVLRVPQSQAAEDLGLIPVAANTSAPATPATPAVAILDPAGANNAFSIASLNPGTQLNGVAVSFIDTGLGPGNETVTYNAVARTLVFDITAGVTTAGDLVNLVNTDPVASAVFTAALVPTDGTPNDGTGTYGLGTTATLAGGTAETLSGRDVNPQEVSGVFNALLRLRAALNQNDAGALQRAIELLDAAAFKINFARADSGARQQGLDVLNRRLDTEDTELRQALSNDIDADITKVVTDLTARQTSLQAALQATAQTFKLTLLDYL